MTWFKVDDQWHDHPKCLGLSFAAKGLWAHAGSWCAAKLTDGFVPRGALKVWSAAPALAAELVSHGLWIATESGWQFHDWTEHQPSKDDVVKKREKIRDRVARHRARNGVTGALPETDQEPCNGVTKVTVTLPPSRPVPSRPVERENARDLGSKTPPTLEHEIRIGFSKRLESAAAAIPNQRALGALVRDLVPWVEQTAPLRKLSETELVNRVLDGFFANDYARQKSFPPAYLAQNPLEYLEAKQLKPQLTAAAKIPDGIPPIQHFGPREETG